MTRYNETETSNEPNLLKTNSTLFTQPNKDSKVTPIDSKESANSMDENEKKIPFIADWKLIEENAELLYTEFAKIQPVMAILLDNSITVRFDIRYRLIQYVQAIRNRHGDSNPREFLQDTIRMWNILLDKYPSLRNDTRIERINKKIKTIKIEDGTAEQIFSEMLSWIHQQNNNSTERQLFSQKFENEKPRLVDSLTKINELNVIQQIEGLIKLIEDNEVRFIDSEIKILTTELNPEEKSVLMTKGNDNQSDMQRGQETQSISPDNIPANVQHFIEHLIEDGKRKNDKKILEIANELTRVFKEKKNRAFRNPDIIIHLRKVKNEIEENWDIKCEGIHNDIRNISVLVIFVKDLIQSVRDHGYQELSERIESSKLIRRLLFFESEWGLILSMYQAIKRGEKEKAWESFIDTKKNLDARVRQIRDVFGDSEVSKHLKSLSQLHDDIEGWRIALENIVSGFSEKERIFELTNNAKRELISLIESSVQNLLGLSNELAHCVANILAKRRTMLNSQSEGAYADIIKLLIDKRKIHGQQNELTSQILLKMIDRLKKRLDRRYSYLRDEHVSPIGAFMDDLVRTEEIEQEILSKINLRGAVANLMQSEFAIQRREPYAKYLGNIISYTEQLSNQPEPASEDAIMALLERAGDATSLIDVFNQRAEYHQKHSFDAIASPLVQNRLIELMNIYRELTKRCKVITSRLLDISEIKFLDIDGYKISMSPVISETLNAKGINQNQKLEVTSYGRA